MLFNHSYKVYEVKPDRLQIADLMEWEYKVGIDFWTQGGILQPSRIMVSPEIEASFLDFLKYREIAHELAIENVKTSLHNDKIARMKSSMTNLAHTNEANFQVYWSYAEMEAYLQHLADDYPNLVKLETIGKSFEGRNIHGLKISKNTEFGINPIIFIDAGTHAREWAGIQSAFYFLHQLVENTTASTELTDKLDFVFVPMVNPDGYVYSFTEDRLWRKNRRYVNYTCTGIDLNRNYPYMWRYRSNSCASNGYSGASALSEPEIKAVADYMQSFKYNLRLYLSTHTCGNLVLWPFGFAFDVYIKNHKEHHMLGERFASAIRNATGKSYLVGNSADVLYTANGEHI